MTAAATTSQDHTAAAMSENGATGALAMTGNEEVVMEGKAQDENPKPGAGESGSFGQRTSRDRILDAATGLFGKHGYVGASMRDIARMAGINVASVNYYWNAKVDLWRAACELGAKQLAATLEHVEAVTPRAAGPNGAGDDLMPVVDAWLEAVFAAPQGMLLLAWATESEPAARRAAFAAYAPFFEAGQVALAKLGLDRPGIEKQLWLGLAQLDYALTRREAADEIMGEAAIDPAAVRHAILAGLLTPMPKQTYAAQSA